MDFHLHITDPVIEENVAREILESAGRYEGLMDFRPLFGLFDVEKFDRIKCFEIISSLF